MLMNWLSLFAQQFFFIIFFYLACFSLRTFGEFFKFDAEVWSKSANAAMQRSQPQQLLLNF